VCAVSQNANEDTSQLTPKERIRRNKEQQMQVGGRGLVREVAGGLSGKWQGACQGSGRGLVREVARGLSGKWRRACQRNIFYNT